MCFSMFCIAYYFNHSLVVCSSAKLGIEKWWQGNMFLLILCIRTAQIDANCWWNYTYQLDMVLLHRILLYLRLGFLYPPTQVSTATSQGCLYSCDACTLRAVHLLSHSPQPADLTWTAGCTRDKATAIWSIFLCQGRLFLFCSPGCGNLQVLVWRISFYPRLQSPTSPIPGGGPATQTFPSVQPSTWR
jgi:hypothetical protein